jgi:hypothetical protein
MINHVHPLIILGVEMTFKMLPSARIYHHPPLFLKAFSYLLGCEP